MRLLTVEEVSGLLSLPRSRVYQLARVGLLPVVHLGRQVRVSEKALHAWVDGGGRGLPSATTRGGSWMAPDSTISAPTDEGAQAKKAGAQVASRGSVGTEA